MARLKNNGDQVILVKGPVEARGRNYASIRFMSNGAILGEDPVRKSRFTKIGKMKPERTFRERYLALLRNCVNVAVTDDRWLDRRPAPTRVFYRASSVWENATKRVVSRDSGISRAPKVAGRMPE